MAKSSRFRLYTKLALASVFVCVVATLLWFIFRIEKIILSELDESIAVEDLYVSVLNSTFVAQNVRVVGDSEGDCAGATIFEVKRLTGKFTWTERKLVSLILDEASFFSETLKKNCLFSRDKKPGFRIQNVLPQEGISITVKGATILEPFFGPISTEGVFVLKQEKNGEAILSFSNFVAKNYLAKLDVPKGQIEFVKNASGLSIKKGSAKATLYIPELQKLPQLRQKNFRIVQGSSLLRFTVDISNERYALYSMLDLKNLKLVGRPFYDKMFIKLTPENVWPMVEDSPGLFTVTFKTVASRKSLPRQFAIDLKHAIIKKAKLGLKKKIPILPF